MGFTWIDWVIAGVIVVSALISLKRGFFKEVLSLLTWAAAAFVAWTFGDVLAEQFTRYIDTPSVRITIASLLLFVATLLVGAFINRVVSEFVEATGLSGTDRALGMVFGGLRGCLVVVALISLMTLAPLEQDRAWKNSVLLPHFVELANWSRDQAMTIIGPFLQERNLTHSI